MFLNDEMEIMGNSDTTSLEQLLAENKRLQNKIAELDEVNTEINTDTSSLQDSERKSRAWIENSPVCTKIVDLDNKLRFMSSSGVMNLNIDDISVYYGKPYPLEFYPDSFKNPMIENLKRVKETGEVITQEAPLMNLEGNEIWFHSTLVPVKDLKGELEYIMVISLDTTERKHAEDELRLSELRLREAQSVAQIGSFEGHINSDELIWSKELYTLFGLNSDEFLANKNKAFMLLHG